MRIKSKRSILAILALCATVSDDQIRESWTAAIETRYRPTIRVLAVCTHVTAGRRSGVVDRGAIYNSEAINDRVGTFTTSQDKCTSELVAINNCRSDTAGVIRMFAGNSNRLTIKVKIRLMVNTGRNNDLIAMVIGSSHRLPDCLIL